MLLEEKADYLDSDAAARYLAVDRDQDTNRELLESGVIKKCVFAHSITLSQK